MEKNERLSLIAERIAYARTAREAKQLLFYWLWLSGDFSMIEMTQLLRVSESWVYRYKRLYQTKRDSLFERPRLLSRAEGAAFLLEHLRGKEEGSNGLKKMYEKEIGKSVDEKTVESFVRQFGIRGRELQKLKASRK
jgi:transposase